MASTHRPTSLYEARSDVITANQLFSRRSEEFVLHAPEIQKQLPKREKPDAIYGLRQTRNIKILLDSPAKPRLPGAVEGNPAQVRDLLLPSPVEPKGVPLLFPFFVLEAKSAISGDDWHSIRMQRAFSIRTFLEAQRQLQERAGDSSRWQPGPLVWFVMNRGEDWRISVAYTQDDRPEPGRIGRTDYVSASGGRPKDQAL